MRLSKPTAPLRRFARAIGDAYWSLANLKTYRFTEDEIARMRARRGCARDTARSIATTCVSRSGKAYEDRGEYAESWRYYAARQCAQALRKPLSAGDHRNQHTQADRNLLTRVLRLARRLWCAADPIRFSSSGCHASGSTLLEQILASHSQVEGTQELSDIQRIVLELQGREPDLDNPRYPGVLADMTAGGLPAARREIPRRYTRLPGRASRISSTRCRTTSATSASST